MVLTTEEVAAELGVSHSRVRRMVMSGELTPCRPGAKPLMFRLDDVVEAGYRRRTGAERDRLDTLAERWRDSGRDVG